jgi:UDP-N-acetylmuramoyl-tripeptide--D-alanyl-D-alanine ligase
VTPDGGLAMSFTLKWYGETAEVTLTHGHLGYVSNALIASAIAYFLKISLVDVVGGLEKYQGYDERFQLYPIKGGRGRLLSDCYNANPESMRAAIEAFGKMAGPGKKVAVIGDMLELGNKEVFLNRQVGRMIAKAGGIESVILVGPLAAAASKALPANTKVMLAATWVEAVAMLDQSLGSEALVLVKGSRGVGLKNLVEKFI